MKVIKTGKHQATSMKQKIITALLLLALCLATIIITTQAERMELVNASESEVSNQPTSFFSTCTLKPERNTTAPSSLTTVAPNQINLDRFRRTQRSLNSVKGETTNPSSFSGALTSYTPKESIALADPTNYGDRFLLDLYGRPAYHSPIVVLHETSSSAQSAINTFLTPHRLDSDQVSYHALIKLNGEIVYFVPPDKRAFGAGDSVFEGENGPETVKTNPDYPPSVNNFAYHVSFETPPDASEARYTHGGYRAAQYQSLAWLVAKTGVPSSRITTHKAVDRSGQRIDPRSFDRATFLRLLEAQPKTNEIVIGCQPPVAGLTP